MRTTENKKLQKLLDQISVPSSSAHFEKTLHQDWRRVVHREVYPSHRMSHVLTLAKSHRRLTAFIVAAAFLASALMGQHVLSSQEEDLRQMDTLSELSLSTL
jgi:hypothetical protein